MKPNIKVIILSLIAIGFIALTFFSGNWYYIIPAIVLMFINQREIMKKK